MSGFALRRSAFCGVVGVGRRASGLGCWFSFVRSGFSSVGRRLSVVSLGLRASGTELRASGFFISRVSCVGFAVSDPVLVGSRVAGVGFRRSLWFLGAEPRASDSSSFGHLVSPVVRCRHPGVGRMSRLPHLRCPLRWCPLPGFLCWVAPCGSLASGIDFRESRFPFRIFGIDRDLPYFQPRVSFVAIWVSGHRRAWGSCRVSSVWRRSVRFLYKSFASFEFLVSSQGSALGFRPATRAKRGVLGVDAQRPRVTTWMLKRCAYVRYGLKPECGSPARHAIFRGLGV
jgi:hypothetical protein